MTVSRTTPVGAPCWIDLTSSDADRARTFYCGLFGWEAEQPDERFGGYFNFLGLGVPTAGCMQSQPDMQARDVWSVYLATDDAEKTLELAVTNGGHVIVTSMAVADLGTMGVVTDPSGASIGLWQPGSFQGFEALGEPGLPSWFELHTRDYESCVSFYRDVFRWDTETMSETAELRYSTLKHGGEQLAGIMDTRGNLPEGMPSHWQVYFEVNDTDGALTTCAELGGSVIRRPEDTPYGRLAEAADPMGARFKLLAHGTQA